MNAQNTLDAMLSLNTSSNCEIDGNDVRSSLFKLEVNHIDHLAADGMCEFIDKCIEERHDMYFNFFMKNCHDDVAVIQRGCKVSLLIMDSNYGTVNVDFPFVLGRYVATYFYKGEDGVEKVKVLTDVTVTGLLNAIENDLLH